MRGIRSIFVFRMCVIPNEVRMEDANNLPNGNSLKTR